MYSLIIIADFLLIFIIAVLNSFLEEGTSRLYSDTKLKSASTGSTVLTSLSHQSISFLFFSSTVASQTVSASTTKLTILLN